MTFDRVLRRLRTNRRLDLALFGLLVAIALVVLRLLPEAEIAHATGRVRVIDGDSIIVQGTEIRLQGIDAPEAGQSCGREASQWPCGSEASWRLREKLQGQLVDCKGTGYDMHRRLLARCWTAETDVNRWMVEQGWAVSYYDYAPAERVARQAQRGLWSGEFELPRDWRLRHGGS